MTESITRILVPVDFSAHSDRAVRYAARLAGQVGASVGLLHVVDDISYGVLSEVYLPNMPDLIQELVNSASRRLTAIATDRFPPGADVQTAVVVGRPATAIADHAAGNGFDLVVMGTHGRTGLPHLFMGSVAERVVRTAECAVLTVRGPAAGDAFSTAAPSHAA
jgi:nucleotide-binding universal stress UspA family protein